MHYFISVIGMLITFGTIPLYGFGIPQALTILIFAAIYGLGQYIDFKEKVLVSTIDQELFDELKKELKGEIKDVDNKVSNLSINGINRVNSPHQF